LGGVGFFCPTPDVQSDNFLHHTPELGIPVVMAQFLMKQISCCAPRFPLILKAKFYSHVKESDILPLTPQPWLLHVFPVTYCEILMDRHVVYCIVQWYLTRGVRPSRGP